MRMMAIFMLLMAGQVHASEIKLSGTEIIAILNNMILTAKDSDRNIVQIFQKAGVTLYVVDGQQSQGFWRVTGEKYCSQWPPHDQWDCYDITQDGKTIAFISVAGKRYEMLLPGAEN